MLTIGPWKTKFGGQLSFDATHHRQAASLTIDARLAADVRLHRCLFTQTVVGASLSRLHE
jgi:hypothetical protein